MENQVVTEPKETGITNHLKRKLYVKRAITANLAGFSSRRGLLFKAMEQVNQWLDKGDADEKAKAVDIVLKLLPYAVEREGQVTGVQGATNGSSVINVQINNFDSFIKDRLANTNLGKLLNGIDLQQGHNVTTEVREVK